MFITEIERGDYMICQYCKHELPNGSIYCLNCGLQIKKQNHKNEIFDTYLGLVQTEIIEINRSKAKIEKIERKIKRIKKCIGFGIPILLIIAIGGLAFFVPEILYQRANSLVKKGEYQEALNIYIKLSEHRDVNVQMDICRELLMKEQYEEAIKLYKNSEYEKAEAIFGDLGDFLDSYKYRQKCQNEIVINAIPEYEWELSENLEESNEYTSTAYGDVKIIEAEDISAAYFDGDGDYIICGEDLNMTDNFTFNAFICCQDVEKNHSAFFAKYETAGEGPYSFFVNRGNIECWITDANKNHIVLRSKTKLKNNYWYCISVVKNGVSIYLYINGKAEDQTTVDKVMENRDTVTIGRQNLLYFPEDQLQFTGYISKLRIYYTAFNATQIQTLVQSYTDMPINDDKFAN